MIAPPLFFYVRSIQAISHAECEIVHNVVLGGCLNSLMAECLLCEPYILLGQARANKAPEIMRLDVSQATSLGVTLHHFPSARRVDRGGAWLSATSATKAGKDIV